MPPIQFSVLKDLTGDEQTNARGLRELQQDRTDDQYFSEVVCQAVVNSWITFSENCLKIDTKRGPIEMCRLANHDSLTSWDMITRTVVRQPRSLKPDRLGRSDRGLRRGVRHRPVQPIRGVFCVAPRHVLDLLVEIWSASCAAGCF